MYFTQSISCNKRGLQTVTAVFMLLIMLAFLTGLLAAFQNYRQSTQQQMTTEQARIEEKIMLSKETNQQLYTVSNVIITNIGEIEVKIRAIYKIVDGESIFICDPSADPSNLNTHIAPSKTLSIDLAPYDITADAKIVAATERGTKTMEYDPYLFENSEVELANYDPTKLYVGPLMLKFDDFWYIRTLSDGSFDPADQWSLGWNITDATPVSIAWNITIMNIGDRNITLNRLSAFNLILTGSPSSLPWYIEPTNHVANTIPLIINQTTTVTFIWDTPVPNAQAQRLSSTFKDSTSMVFLTFFGVFHEPDETTKAYAQTIPFEAAISII